MIKALQRKSFEQFCFNLNQCNTWKLMALTHQRGQHLSRKTTHTFILTITTASWKPLTLSHTHIHTPSKVGRQATGSILEAGCVYVRWCITSQLFSSVILASLPLLPSAHETHLSLISPVVVVGCHPVNGSCDVSPQPCRQSCHNVAISTIWQCKWTTCYAGCVC